MENNNPNFAYTLTSVELTICMLEGNPEILMGCSLKVSAQCSEAAVECKMGMGKY